MTVRDVPIDAARRLAVARQRLAGPEPADRGPEAIVDLVRDLGCLQLDPTRTVERSQLLVLHSRLGRFNPSHLERLASVEHRLFEYWAHEYSLVLAEDYQLHALGMRVARTAETAGARRARAWLDANDGFRREVMAALEARGPLPAREIEDRAALAYAPTGGWSTGRNVARLLDLLSVRGEVLVARRSGGQRLWDLAERCLPADVERDPLPTAEIVRHAAQRALRALGVATPAQVRAHFTRGRYPGLDGCLAGLVAEGAVMPVRVLDAEDRPLRGRWYLHAEDEPLLAALETDGLSPRSTLLSPFDNLICDRRRTEALFGFRFRLEIYTPVAKRVHGFFVMPVLHGDRLIARVDPRFDRTTETLAIVAVHPEPGLRLTRGNARVVDRAVRRLARFLRAREISYGSVPPAWQEVLR